MVGRNHPQTLGLRHSGFATVFAAKAGASSNAINVAALCRARLLPLGLAESSGGVKENAVHLWGF